MAIFKVESCHKSTDALKLWLIYESFGREQKILKQVNNSWSIPELQG
ncbi:MULTISPECIES: hypothetical protein [Trichocoleus]|uniref:Uncharacterized protein n=1 Tax=Trichocoleus desertorum GB2-A4 TaxID=2933944 RepID=A0ABV0J7P9_9CYAN|nr:hypothetical protein [Trichocoleus sp. FACHB-46]MBD1863982.1 hypothetical protein [Trichocoleus sp. FACHB-46]